MHNQVRIQSWIGTCSRKSNHPCLHTYEIHLIHKHTSTQYLMHITAGMTSLSALVSFSVPHVSLPPASPSLSSSVPSLSLLFYSSSPTSNPFPPLSSTSLSFPCPSHCRINFSPPHPPVSSSLFSSLLFFSPPTLPHFALFPSPCCHLLFHMWHRVVCYPQG